MGQEIKPFKPLNIGGQSAERPIIQGGMGIGVSLSGLAGAVAASGGVGVISAANLGFASEDFWSNPLAANLRALAGHITAARQMAKGGLIGVNIMCVTRKYEEYVRVCLESGADIIFSGAGLPVKLPELAGAAAAKLAPIISSLKAAKVLLQLWDKRYARTADMVIVEGPKAGGHLGFTPEEAEDQRDFAGETASIIDFIRGYEDKYNKAIPVVFGGGIFDRADAARYIGLGCGGVQVASRFVATEECDAHENFKRAYINANPGDIGIIKSPVGMPGRALKNDFTRRAEGERVPVGRCFNCMDRCDPATTPYCISEALITAVKGDTDNGLVFCGAETGRIREMTTVPKLMAELAGG